MKANEVRDLFIKFFESKGHQKINSSSSVPYDDPTLLFTNAGMNQFKDYFLGNDKPEFLRAVTVQKIIRAGGKHNDLDNVGKTARHHTFFEMLGNFSFGDYFKDKAIAYAWEFLIQKLKLDKNKLAVSVYEKDDKAFEIWQKNIGIPKERIARLGEKDNFWSMGDVGPCGPCSEIHFDLNGVQKNRSVIESLKADDGRFLEVWNLVFMQFNRQKDGTLQPLPAPSVDTGMGLERIVSVMQGVDSNYKTDLFLPLLDFICKLAVYNFGSEEKLDCAVRIIADHVRSSSIIIADGVLPANEGRGYVLRRIIRRALLNANYLELKLGSFAEVSSFFSEEINSIYPEVLQQKDSIQKILVQEEERFASTLKSGMKILSELIEKARKEKQKQISGASIFKLYDTYGFPVDMTEDILETEEVSYDKKEFEFAMRKQQETSRAAQHLSHKIVMKPLLEIQDKDFKNEFIGYNQLKTKSSIAYIWSKEKVLTEIKQGEKFYLALDKTPFYAESGGQIGDSGKIINENFCIQVLDTQKSPSGLNYSKAILKTANNPLIVKEQLLKDKIFFDAEVDVKKRSQTEIHHTATHLLHSALRETLGEHVKQAGSLVEAKRLRFDFQHFEAIPPKLLAEIESLVNKLIGKNEKIISETVALEEALKKGALAFFGEKYAAEVRVITAGSHSMELCGGCHTTRTGDLEKFEILSEVSSAAGIRRIEAVAGNSYNELQAQKVKKALEILEKNKALYKKIEKLSKEKKEIYKPSLSIQDSDRLLNITKQEKKITNELNLNLKEKIKILSNPLERENFNQIAENLKEIDKEIQRIEQNLSNIIIAEIQAPVEKNGEKLFFEKNPSHELANKPIVEALLQKIETGIVCVYKKPSQTQTELTLTRTKNLNDFHCGEFIKKHCGLIQGKGGGSPLFAQCRGNNPAGLKEMKKQLEKII